MHPVRASPSNRRSACKYQQIGVPILYNKEDRPHRLRLPACEQGPELGRLREVLRRMLECMERA